MKKTYIKPITVNYFISTQRMICGSEILDGSKQVTDINDLQSRRDRGSFWDDEDE